MIGARWRQLTDFTMATHTVRPDLESWMVSNGPGDATAPRYPRVRGYVHLTRIGLVLSAAALWLTLIAPAWPLGAILVVLGGHVASLAWNLWKFGASTAFPKFLRVLPQLVVVGVPIVGVLYGRGWGWLALVAWLLLYLSTLFLQD